MISSIWDHCNSKDHTFKYEYFNVLDYSASNTDLRILESLYILKFSPSINIDRSAVQLYIASLGCIRTQCCLGMTYGSYFCNYFRIILCVINF